LPAQGQGLRMPPAGPPDRASTLRRTLSLKLIQKPRLLRTFVRLNRSPSAAGRASLLDLFAKGPVRPLVSLIT
jgi:hypothetical protein